MRLFRNKFILILSVIIGELGLVVLTTFVQEYIFRGISYTTSPLPVLIIGGLLTFLAAIGAGILSALPSGKALHMVPIILSLLVVLEMTYLISAGITGDPIWFDILAGFTLIAGICLGYYGWFKFNSKRSLQ
jgi:hypothetical protein